MGEGSFAKQAMVHIHTSMMYREVASDVNQPWIEQKMHEVYILGQCKD